MRATPFLSLALLALLFRLDEAGPPQSVAAGTTVAPTPAIAGLRREPHTDSGVMTPVYRLGGTSRALAVGEGYAYLGVGGRLVVVDATDPFQPLPVGHVDLENEPTAIAVRGSQLLVVASPTVYALEVAAPARPRVVGTYVSSVNLAPLIGLHGDYAYVVSREAIFRDYSCRLLVLDASDPQRLRRVAGRDTVCPSQMMIRGDLAYLSYVAGGMTGPSTRGAIRLLDLTDPTRPVNIADTPTTNAIVGLHVADGALYAAVDGPTGYDPVEDRGGLRVYDLDRPWAPRQAGALLTDARLEGLIASGERAYVRELRGGRLDGERTERLVSLSQPFDPMWLGSVDLPIDFHAVTPYRHRLLAAALHGGLDVLGIGNKAEPKELPGWDVPAGAVDIAVADEVLVVPTGFEDAASPTDSVLLPARPASPEASISGGWSCPSAKLAAASGTTAYLGTAWGLQAVDLSDPTRPVELGRLEQDWSASRMVLGGEAAYVNSREGLYTIDIADPGALRIVGLTPPDLTAPFEPGGLALEGCTAAAAWGAAGLALFDVCQDGPAQLIEVYSWPEDEEDRPLRVADVALQGDIAYAAVDDLSGVMDDSLLILDVSSPADGVELGRVRIDGGLTAVAASGSRVFAAGVSLLVGDTIGRVWAVDVSDPSAPEVIERATVPGQPARAVVDGGDLYVASGTGGLHALRLRPTGFQPAFKAHLPCTLTD